MIYISSKGEKKETSTMPIEYIYRALEKAKKEGNNANIVVLEDEIEKREK